MKTWILMCCLLVCTAVGFCQDSLKANPIIFMEGFVGGSVVGARGWNIGLSLNYQFKRNFLTVKGTSVMHWAYNADEKKSFIFFPFPNLKNNYDELAVLYGLRFIKEDHSLNLSLGLSHNWRTQYFRNEASREEIKSNYIGLPYEFTIKWFNRDKERYRIYGLIPVGKPTALGHSYGLKLYGNISKNSYAAIGLASSFGYHKRY